MTVAQPSVSTAGSRRTSTCRAAIRCTPTASAMVTIAGSPSGTAATASDTADRNTSSGGSPRSKPDRRDDRDDPEAQIEQHLAHARQPLLQRRLVLRRRREQVRDLPELRPHAGRDHLGDARPGRDRRAHEHADRAARRAARRRGAVAGRLLDRRALAGERRLVGRERVRLDEARVRRDDVARFEQRARRPGRPRRPEISTGRPSRSTRARGAVSARSARTARSARDSWKKPTAPFRTTIDADRDRRRRPRRAHAETTQAPSSSQMSGLANWPREQLPAGGGLLAADLVGAHAREALGGGGGGEAGGRGGGHGGGKITPKWGRGAGGQGLGPWPSTVRCYQVEQGLGRWRRVIR